MSDKYEAEQSQAELAVWDRSQIIEPTIIQCRRILDNSQLSNREKVKALDSEMLLYRGQGLKFHYDRNNKPVIDSSANNFLRILQGVEGAHIYYDIRQGCPVQIIDGKTMQWTDRDAASQMLRFEKDYGILARDKYQIAFNAYMKDREINPLANYLDSLQWDGKKRVETFLIKWAGASDDAASREISRLTFAGGTWRAYKPGCRFDEVPVLIGKQGAGKSTLVQWLAMKPEWYTSIKTFEGKDAEERIQGSWIVEIEELNALFVSRSRNQGDDSAKAFLSAKDSRFRHAYAHHAERLGRTCIFIGTTNHPEFLTDLTGNRRYYPITIKPSIQYLYDHREEIEEDIRQAWAEMREAYKAGDELARPAINPTISEDIENLREEAAVDDWRVGEITEFLNNKTETHILEIWKEALHKGPNCPDMKTKDSRDIGQILRNLGWTAGSARRDKDGNNRKMYYAPTKEKSDESGYIQVEPPDEPFCEQQSAI